MSDSNRPVYTKTRTTKRKRPRLHGAFKGGFSAGHFNTAGSVNGWRPSDEGLDLEQNQSGENANNDDDDDSRPKAKSKSGATLSSKKGTKQRVEDFMDAEDANDWGGPSAVSKDYSHGFHKRDDANANADGGVNSAASIGEFLSGSIKLQNNGSIGKQLLHTLGWREKKDGSGDGTSYVYVPMDESEKIDTNEQNSFLASKRLKRIELKLSKHQNASIPPPKIDTYGIGYEPFQNAPEFKAHKELRKRRAEMRAIAATSTHGDKRMNVYRTSALSDLYEDAGDDDGFEMARKRGGRGEETKASESQSEGNDGEEQGDILAYETTEDFVGSKTTGGFALHDDDDDVYDNPMANIRDRKLGDDKDLSSRPRVDEGEYHTEIFEASDSDVEGDHFSHIDIDAANRTGKNQNDVFAGALSAWAAGNSSAGVTHAASKKVIAVTSDGRPPLKGFAIGGDANRTMMKRFPGPDIPVHYVAKRHLFPQAALDKLKALSSHMKLQIKSHQNKETHKGSVYPNQSGIKRDSKPMAGGSFSALSSQLKDRFTASSNTSDERNGRDAIAPLDPTKVTIARKTITWQPSPLLCKRFGVSVPRVTHVGSQVTSSATKRSESREESFFRNQVIGKLDSSRQANTNDNEKEEDVLSEEHMDIERPTMELMRSIFEPESDDDMSISDEEIDDEGEQASQVDTIQNDSRKSEDKAIAGNDEAKGGSECDGAIVKSNESDVVAKKKDRTDRRREHKYSSEDDSIKQSASSASESDGNKKRHRKRHRKDRKHRKHKRERKDDTRKRRKRDR